MSNEELDSQLSAMFDDELSTRECEWLARRLSRDRELKARWGRYALISATMRAETAAQLDGAVAQRVSAALASEPALAARWPTVAAARRSGSQRWQQALAGGAVAASVAALSIFWLRSQQLPDEVLFAQQSSVPPAAIVASSEPDSYTVPTVIEPPAVVPTAELANYVVAHSEFSGPFVRRNTLSTLVASDAGPGDEASAGNEAIETDVRRSTDAPPGR
jgi:negative regulator of sigma E activity